MVGHCLVHPVLAAVVAVLITGSLADWETKVNDEGKRVQQLKIQAPTMTEEDQYGWTMPEQYRCDSCKAVVFHLNAAFKARHPKSRKMKEWEYTELFEDTCRSGFEGYGIKLVNGKNALSGPGLPQADDLKSGDGMIQMGGDSWKKRLSEMCRELVNDKVGEEELYERYQSAGEIPQSMCWDEMAQCSAGPRTPKPKQKKAQGGRGCIAGQRCPAEKAARAAALESKQKEQVAAITVTEAANVTVNKTDPQDQIDLATFLRSKALEDGLASDIYSSLRPHNEWEKFILSMAGKIYSRHAK